MAKPLRRLEDLQPDESNPNKHTRRGMRMLEDSMRQVGAARPILATEDGVVLAGNATLETAVDVGLDARVVEAAADELVVVQRMDVESGSAMADRIRLGDNRIGEANLMWDREVLKAERSAGALGDWYEQNEMDEMLGAERVAAKADAPAPAEERRRVEAAVAGSPVLDTVQQGGRIIVKIVFRTRTEAEAFAKDFGLDPEDRQVDGVLWDGSLSERRKQ